MTGFSGRRGHGVYSSIANLNTVPSDYELAMQQQQEGYNMQADLDLFTNAQFFDFDMAEMPSQSPTAFNDTDLILSNNKPGVRQQPLNYLNGVDGEYQIPSYSAHSSSTHPQPNTALPHRAPAQPHQPSQFLSNVSSPASTASLSTPPEKRKFDATAALDPSNPQYLEEASRVAAEEDKRRRNTAASARFRVKKKQREAALEKTAKDMTDRVTYLENRVAQLEMENKLLKDLITEKGGKEVDMAELKRKSKGDTKVHPVKGVGTEDDEKAMLAL